MAKVVIRIVGGIPEVVFIDHDVDLLVVDEDVNPSFTLKSTGEEVVVESYNDDGTLNVRIVDIENSNRRVIRNVEPRDLEWLQDDVDNIDPEEDDLVGSFWGEDD
jgi:hypothetical protein